MKKKKSEAAKNLENEEGETSAVDESYVSDNQLSFGLLSSAIENDHLNSSQLSQSSLLTASQMKKEMDVDDLGSMDDVGDVDTSQALTTFDMESPKKGKEQAEEPTPVEHYDSSDETLSKTAADEVSDSPKKTKKKKGKRPLHDINPVWEDGFVGDESEAVHEHEDVSKAAKKKKQKHKRKRNEDSITEDTVEDSFIFKTPTEPGQDDIDGTPKKKKKKREHKTVEEVHARNVDEILTTTYIKQEPVSSDESSPSKKEKQKHRSDKKQTSEATDNCAASAETCPDDQHSSPGRKKKKKKKKRRSELAVDLDSTVEPSDTEESAGKSPENLNDMYDFHEENLTQQEEKSSTRTKVEEKRKKKKKKKQKARTTDESRKSREKEKGWNVRSDGNTGSEINDENRQSEKEMGGNVWTDESSASETFDDKRRRTEETGGKASPAKRVGDSSISQPCYICREQMTSKFSYTQHLAELHEKKSYQCPKCQRPLASDQGVQDHLAVSCPLKHSAALMAMFQCRHCPLSYTHKRSLNRHLRTEHGIGPPPKLERCSHCDKEFSSSQRLKSHEVKCQEGLLKKPRGEDLECDQCSKVFSSAPARSYHIRTIHGGHIFDCVCGKQFRGSSLYYNHRTKCTL